MDQATHTNYDLTGSISAMPPTTAADQWPGLTCISKVVTCPFNADHNSLCKLLRCMEEDDEDNQMTSEILEEVCKFPCSFGRIYATSGLQSSREDFPMD